jgi:hypothetical protein
MFPILRGGKHCRGFAEIQIIHASNVFKLGLAIVALMATPVRLIHDNHASLCCQSKIGKPETIHEKCEESMGKWGAKPHTRTGLMQLAFPDFIDNLHFVASRFRNE